MLKIFALLSPKIPATVCTLHTWHDTSSVFIKNVAIWIYYFRLCKTLRHQPPPPPAFRNGCVGRKQLQLQRLGIRNFLCKRVNIRYTDYKLHLNASIVPTRYFADSVRSPNRLPKCNGGQVFITHPIKNHHNTFGVEYIFIVLPKFYYASIDIVI